jgi:surface antigen
MRYFIVFLVLLATSSALAENRFNVYVLNKSDLSTLNNGFQYAMENAGDHQATDWLNSATGLSGSTIPFRTYRTAHGQYCREYQASVKINGAIQQSFGTACRQADGHWTIAGEKLVKRPYQQVKFAVIVQPRQHNCPFASSHPSLGHSKVKRSPHGNYGRPYHGKKFYEKLRQMRRAPQPGTVPRKLEKPPSKLIKLVGN